jgi:glycosyltransferase involved in cell wall biosynthesis
MRVVMAGPTGFDYAQTLKTLAENLGISECIYWTGMLSGEAKWGSFQAAEAFVLPSHQENFGIAVAEALSARLPVLISHSVNISPEIGFDGAGFVEDDTLEGTILLLKRWVSLPDTMQTAMRQQARETFLARYTSVVAAKDMQRQIFLSLAARRAGA